MPRRRQRSARAFSLVFVEPSPLRPVVDVMLVDDEPTLLADGFDCVGGDSTVALGALIRFGFGLDVFVERRLVNVSGCHGYARGDSRGSRLLECPSPITGHIHTTRDCADIDGFGGESPAAQRRAAP